METEASSEMLRPWSGQITLPEDIRGAVSQAAAADERTITNWIAVTLRKELRKRRLLSQPMPAPVSGGGR